MTLAQYLENCQDEVAGWPGGEMTLSMLNSFMQGCDVASFGDVAKEALLNCYAVLRDLAQTAADAELRAEAETHLAGVAKTLRTIYGDEPR